MSNNGRLETICEHMKQIKRGGRGRDIIKLILINLHLKKIIILSFFHIFKVKLQLNFQILWNY
jgi:hypothetical protein